MKTMKNSKKNETRVLIASLSIAAVAVAGATFAWFTSKDEVTNRLTASANYGVSIVEDFTPPEDWTPGQKINKDVSAVNTGNVDAYVRLAILNDLKLTTAGSGKPVDSNANVLPTAPDNEAFVELHKTAVEAVSATETANAVDKIPNSVSTLQAGGTLVWTPDGAVSPTDAQNKSAGDDVTGGADADDYDAADQFVPTATGLYLFKRTVYEGEGGNQTKYSGYFYDATAQKYYALETEPNTVYATATVTESNGIVTAVTGAKLATTKDTVISNTSTTDLDLMMIEWFKGNVGERGAADANKLTTAGDATATWIQLTYTAVTGNPIKIDIELASNWATNWTYVQTNVAPKVDDKNDIGYFYYKNIVKAGNTTPKLIDSVTLDSDVTQDAYNDLVYDLSVVLDSIQVAKSEDQATYTNDTAKTWLEGAVVDGTSGAVTWKSAT